MKEEEGGADRAQYGKEVIRELAARLTSEFGNGFSKSNLEYMRRFYLAYPNRTSQIAQTLSGQSVTSSADLPLPSVGPIIAIGSPLARKSRHRPSLSSQTNIVITAIATSRSEPR